MKKLWTKEDDDVLIESYPSTTNKELAIILGRTAEAVRSRARQLGLKKDKQKSWTKEEEEYLKNNYSIKPIKELMLILERSRASIFCKADQLGLTIRNSKRKNTDFFKKIDTESKAYWLGFIYADGYVCINKTGAELGIQLASVDVSHLHKLNEVFNNYYKVQVFRKKANAYNKKPTEMCGIRIFSKEIVEDLISNGVVENKTNSPTFPKIDDEGLFFHFLRGYIDGDGSYCIKKSTSSTGGIKLYPRITIAGNNKEMFTYVKERLESIGIGASCYADKSGYKFQVGKTEDCFLLMKLLYRESTIFLDRKYDKMQEITKLAVLGGNTQND